MAILQKFRLSALLVLPLAISLGVFPLQTIAQQNSNSSGGSGSSSGDGGFEPDGSPTTSRGGSSRGICGVATSQTSPRQPSIVALIPATDTELTTQAHPTVYAKISDMTARTAEFSIWDDKLKGFYQTTVSLPAKPGIVAFQLPKEAPPLTIGKRYKWSIALICNPNIRNRDVVVEGWMRRTELDAKVMQQISTASPLQRAALYAKNRVWYEAVSTLVELHQSRPNDSAIKAQLRKLLQSVGLTNML